MGEKPPGPTVSFSIRLVQSQARFAEDMGSQEERFLTLFPCPAQHRRAGSPESRCDVCDAARRPHHEELSVQALTPGPGHPKTSPPCISSGRAAGMGSRGEEELWPSRQGGVAQHCPSSPPRPLPAQGAPPQLMWRPGSGLRLFFCCFFFFAPWF